MHKRRFHYADCMVSLYYKVMATSGNLENRLIKFRIFSPLSDIFFLINSIQNRYIIQRVFIQTH